MDQQNTPPTPNNTSNNINPPPERLPILENKKVITHTMKEDIAQAQSHSGLTAGGEALSAQKPFSANIPPPPLPPIAEKTQSDQDAFRESINDRLAERDQAFPIPGMSDQDQTPEQFKIQIPQTRSGLNPTTIILVAVLAILIAGGGFGYYWFFVKESVVIIPPTNQAPIPPAPIPVPIIPTPPPEPLPIPIEPEPILIPPPATSTPPIATSTPPVIKPTPPPVIIEPTKPQAILSLDQDIVIEITKIDKTAALEKIKTENSKISKIKASVRYAFKLSNDTEKRFLTARETAQMLGLTLSQEFWQSSDGFDFIGYKNEKIMRYGLAVNIKTGKDQFKNFAGKWETSILDDLNALYIEKSYAKPKTIVFSENTYLDFYKRFVNMPLPDISFDYAISDKYFITATSKEMIYAILDKTKSETPPSVIPTATSTQEIILGK